jgi:hypothetical protein
MKSGTSQFHGDAYEFFQNDGLNANEYFHNANGQKRPTVRQNIFGGSLGGPVAKDSLGFFYVNYQGTRQTSALSPGTQVSNPGFPVIPTDRSDASISQAFSAIPPAIDPVEQATNLKATCSMTQRVSDSVILVRLAPGFCWSPTRKYTRSIHTTGTAFNAKDKRYASFLHRNALPFGQEGCRRRLAEHFSAASRDGP